MKAICFFLCMLLFASSSTWAENAYTGSTPANAAVRAFIGISPAEPVDFIRWKLTFYGNRYELQCNYGVGQPNTNGFVNGGKNNVLKGEYRKEANTYQFHNGNQALKAVEFNSDMLHLLNEDKSLMVGNAGWSYTLNNLNPSAPGRINLVARPARLADSLVFDGRTPCNIPGLLTPGRTCYKIKWTITLYANAGRNMPLTYKIRGTAWRNQGFTTGTWKIITAPNGQVTYQLNNDDGTASLYLLQADERILVFTDAKGRLLVGDEDFSYTLNRRE